MLVLAPAGTVVFVSVFFAAVFAEAVFAAAVFADEVFAAVVFAEALFAAVVFADEVFAAAVFADSLFAAVVFADEVFAAAVFAEAVFGAAVFRFFGALTSDVCVTLQATAIFFSWVVVRSASPRSHLPISEAVSPSPAAFASFSCVRPAAVRASFTRTPTFFAAMICPLPDRFFFDCTPI